MNLLLSLLSVAFARQVSITEISSKIVGKCASQISNMICQSPERLEVMGLKAYVEELAHGNTVYVVPCGTRDGATLYVTLWENAGQLNPLFMDQWNGAWFQSKSLATTAFAYDKGQITFERDGISGRYRFRSRDGGVSLRLMELNLAHENGRRELLYFQRP